MQVINVPGVGQVNFPDDMSQENIISAIENDILPKANDAAKPYMPDISEGTKKGLKTAAIILKNIPGLSPAGFALDQAIPEKKRGEKFYTGTSRGLANAGQGLKQISLEAGENLGLVPEGRANQYTKETDKERAAYAATPIAQEGMTKAGELLGSTAPFMLAPGGIAGGLLARAGTGALSGMGIGASQYVPENGSRGFNTTLGGLLGAGMPFAIAGAAKGINAIKGGTEAPVQKAMLEAGAKHNVPVYPSDISNSQFLRSTSQALEDIPIIGMRKQRQGQMEAAQQAAEKVTNDLSNEMLATPFGGKTGQSLINKAAASGGARSKEAIALREEMKNAGDDWNRIAQTSQNVKLFRAKLIADKKYQQVEEAANQYGVIDTSKIISKIDDAMSLENKAVLKNDNLLGTLQKIKNGLSPIKNATAAADDAIPAQGRQLNYSELRRFRSDLSDVISDYFSGNNAAIGKKGVGVLESLKGEIDNTLNKFAQSNGPHLKTLWQNADHFYRSAVAPAKDRLLAKSLTEADPDTIYSKWIMQGDKKDRATRFYQSLDEKGRAAVRYGMVNKAFQSSVKETGEGMFSPGRMAAELEKVKGARGVLFNGADKAEIDGFTNLMRHIDRSYQAINKPDTGVKTIPYFVALLTGAGAAVAPGTTAAALGATGVLKLMMTTKSGRALLLSSSKLKAGTPGMQKVLDNTNKLLQRASVVSGVNAVQPDKE